MWLNLVRILKKRDVGDIWHTCCRSFPLRYSFMCFPVILEVYRSMSVQTIIWSKRGEGDPKIEWLKVVVVCESTGNDNTVRIKQSITNSVLLIDANEFVSPKEFLNLKCKFSENSLVSQNLMVMIKNTNEVSLNSLKQ